MRSVQTPFPLASIEAAQRLGLHLRGKWLLLSTQDFQPALEGVTYHYILFEETSITRSLDFGGSHWPSSVMRNGYAHIAQILAEHAKQPPVMIYQ
ncbi:uncharacterized protein EAE98_003711 [Botrytis deweyae]|uniref:Uncharacterized protein n=1 Tax=Botrytis deweyae TaxID=2478750 RepID=A0ABQ7IUK1_9HELO|nr:uncharacterized protein EAE98_003711 [Botrytis deweyae]KAF7934002.1 hypothetical protein EAE98_003711 [Botrytis deweyae]